MCVLICRRGRVLIRQTSKNMARREHLPVPSAVFQKLKSHIADKWKDVGRNLELTDAYLHNLEKERRFEGQEDVCYGMLNSWKERKGRKATYKELAKALNQAGKTGLAENLLDGKFDDDTAMDISSISGSTSTWAPGSEVAGTSDKPTQKTAAQPAARLPSYKMDNKPRGKCLILTYDEFRDGDTLDEEWSRPGNEVDTVTLKEVFKNFYFDVDSFTNLKKEETMEKINAIAEKRFFDSFILFICSHGNEKSFFTSDKKEIDLQDAITPFNADKCPGFAKKPKMFFFNSCRGEQKDKMIKVTDSGPGSVKGGVGSNLSYYRPTQADFCVVLSAVSGYASFRYMDPTKGSYFVQNFTTTLTKNCKGHHLLDILTMSNDTLLLEFEEERKSSGNPDSECQVPTFISTLSKAVYFVD